MTGHYAPKRTLTIVNLNNSGETTSYIAVENHYWSSISTYRILGSYKFIGWYKGDELVDNDTTLYLIAGNTDIIIEARYSYYPTYTVIVLNENNQGETTTSPILAGESFVDSTAEEQGDYLFVGWYQDGTLLSDNHTIVIDNVTDNITIEAIYRVKETFELTVEKGSGSGIYTEREWVSITANSPSEGTKFHHWDCNRNT